MAIFSVNLYELLIQGWSVEGKLILGRAVMWQLVYNVVSSEPAWDPNRPLVTQGGPLVIRKTQCEKADSVKLAQANVHSWTSPGSSEGLCLETIAVWIRDWNIEVKARLGFGLFSWLRHLLQDINVLASSEWDLNPGHQPWTLLCCVSLFL